MAAILYGRFSPRPNAADCDSVERQLTDLREYCEKNAIPVRAEYGDRALSGADHERPGLWDAIAAVKRGDILLVRNMDRLARDVLLCEMVLKEIADKGALAVSMNGEGTDSQTPEGTFIRQIFQAFAQYQRAVIRSKTAAAMRRHQKNGRRMSEKTPYGWHRDPTDVAQMVRDPTEQQHIEEICEAYREGDSLRSIARTMENRNEPCRGGTWHHATIKSILRREGLIP